MISFRPCSQPLCSIQMLVEDYSNAIYWRIAAIFSTIAALFSAAVVLWFLVFRENPDMPDETDSQEKIRFLHHIDREKHNLLSEVIRTVRQFPYRLWRRGGGGGGGGRADLKCDKSPNFLQRLAYFFFGSNAEYKKQLDLEKLNISDEDLILKGRYNPKRIKSPDAAKSVNLGSKIASVNEKSKKQAPPESQGKNAFTKFFNSKSKPAYVTSKSNKNNNNNADDNKLPPAKADQTPTSKVLKSKFFPRMLSKKKKARQKMLNKNTNNNNNNDLRKVEVDDNLLIELNDSFAHLITYIYVDPGIGVKYEPINRCVTVCFTMIRNACEHELRRVRFLIKAFYKGVFKSQAFLNLKPMHLMPHESFPMDAEFHIRLSPDLNVKKVKLKILIVGRSSGKSLNEDVQREDDENVVLTSKSSSGSKMRLLGGACVKMNDYLKCLANK